MVLAAVVPVALVVMGPSMGLLPPHRRGASDMSDAFAEAARRTASGPLVITVPLKWRVWILEVADIFMVDCAST